MPLENVYQIPLTELATPFSVYLKQFVGIFVIVLILFI